jgi:hypothetical protein
MMAAAETPTSDIGSPFTESIISTYSEDEDMIEEQGPRRKARRGGGKVASTSEFSVYPCSKCFKDLQQCDLSLPKCSRCEANGFECGFKKTEPKANHVSQVLTTMNKVMDQWQDSIDRMAKDFAQKTRDLSVRANNSLKIKPIPQTAWKITTTKKGLSVESNVNSYNDFSTLVDQFKRSMTITPKCRKNNIDSKNETATNSMDEDLEVIEFDDTSSIHTTSGFAIWNQWAHPTHAMPQDYPIDISQELTDNLIELYCRTPCCSSIRLPIIDTTDFLIRYRDPDPAKRPSTVLIYAICAMAARNAFQLHVWSKRPSFEAPQYNMGKALSVAYCLRGRELLSECFDEPTFDNCQAAFLLSYCNYQNGYPGVIYFYEWIAYNMALELGLYDTNRELTPHESMLVWCIYYCNVWYKALQGGDGGAATGGLSHCKPNCPIPDLVARPDQDLFDVEEGEEPNQDIVRYYVWNSWVYLINLQVLRDQSMARLASYQANGRIDTSLPQDLLLMQESLKEFSDNLPVEWQSPILEVHDKDCCSSEKADEHFNVDIKQFSQYCINLVSAHHSINQIILHQAFVPMEKLPSTPISISSLDICLNAANNISQIFESMAQHQKEECHVPLVGFLFANSIYKKLLSYTNDEHYHEIGRSGLLRSVDIAKLTKNYTYDFELARTLVLLMEQDVQLILLQRSTSNNYLSSSSTTDSSPSPSIPSPPHYTPLGQPMKEW